jgi:hypothetical protein
MAGEARVLPHFLLLAGPVACAERTRYGGGTTRTCLPVARKGAGLTFGPRLLGGGGRPPVSNRTGGGFVVSNRYGTDHKVQNFVEARRCGPTAVAQKEE